MAEVTLLSPHGSEAVVTSTAEFNRFVFGNGYRPKTGTISDNLAILRYQPPPGTTAAPFLTLPAADDRYALKEQVAGPALDEAIVALLGDETSGVYLKLQALFGGGTAPPPDEEETRPVALASASMSGPYYTPIPASPVLDPDSATKSATVGGLANHLAGLQWVTANFTVTTDPAYAVVYDVDPEVQPGGAYDWAYQQPAYRAEEVEPVRIPDPPHFYPQPGGYADGPSWDGWGCVIDTARGIGWAGWRMVKVGGQWQAATSHAFTLDTLTTVTAGLGRGDGLPAITGSITVQEVAAAMADTTDSYVIPHALAGSLPGALVDTGVRAPATKTDGTTTPTSSTVSEGARFFLPSGASTASSSRLIRAIVRTLQRYGLYIVDRNGSGDALMLNFERFDPADPADMVAPDTGAPSTLDDPAAIAGAYFRAGMEWDYYSLADVPWSQLQLLQQWDGGGTPPSGGTQTSVTFTIADTLDDGFVSWDALTTAGAAVLGTDYGDAQSRAFFRFPGVTVPAGARIDSATLTLAEGFGSGGLAVAVRGAAADSWPRPATAAEVTGTALTAASTSLTSTAAAWGDGNTTVNVTAQVAEVVARAGWASGNALALLTVDAGTSGDGYFEVNGRSAQLAITYTA